MQTGHSAAVSSVAFSPDGKILASASHDKTIKLWEVGSGKELGTLTGHSEAVLSVAFSRAGNILASGSNDRTIKLWDIGAGKEIHTFNDAAPALGISLVVFSPDGKILASTNKVSRKVNLWQVATGKIIQTFALKKDFEVIRSLAFDSDGKILAGGGSRGTITLWDMATGDESRTLAGHAQSIVAISFSPDDKSLMSVSEDTTVKFWETSTGKELRTLTHSRSVVSAAFSSDGKILAIGGRSAESAIALWEIDADRKIRMLDAASEAVRFVAFSPDRKVLASGGKETITLWDVDTGNKLHTLKGQTSFINALAFSPEGKTLACANNDTTVKLWSFSANQEFRILFGHESAINTVAFSPAGEILAGGSVDGAITLWDIGSSQKLRTLNLPGSDDAESFTYNYSAIAFSPDGRILARDSDAGIKLWEIDTGEEIDAFATEGVIVYSLAFSPDGKFLAAGVGGNIKLWRLRTGKEASTTIGSGLVVHAVAFSPDGKFLASGNGEGEVALWEVNTMRGVYSIAGHAETVNAIAFSPDGKVLVSGSSDHTAKFWQAATGKELGVLAGHFDAVASVAFAPHGKIVASGSRDEKIKLWDSATGKEIVNLIGLDGKDWVAVAHDGRFDGSLEGLQKVHYVQSNQLMPMEAFFERFFAPKLLARVLPGEPDSGAPLGINLSTSIKLPPLVKIISPHAGEPLTTDTIDLIVEAIDQGGGIDEIRLYQNGKQVAGQERNIRPVPESRDKITKSFFITLVAGKNELKAVALNTDRTESRPHIVHIEREAVAPESRLHILAVGINTYKNASLNLNYGKPDAQAFVMSLEKCAKGIFKQVLKRELYDEQATQKGIDDALNAISAAAAPQDVFVFFYAGHGAMRAGEAGTLPEFYLVTSDVTKLYGAGAMPAEKGLSARQLEEFCVKIKAQKQLVVLDACQAGGAVEAFAIRGAAEEKAILQLARSAGVVVLAASGTQQFAMEFGQLGHGVFTYALLQGLSGEADGGTASDGKITVKELEAYLNDKVPELTKQYRGAAQYPNSYARGQDFPLGVLK